MRISPPVPPPGPLSCRPLSGPGASPHNARAPLRVPQASSVAAGSSGCRPARNCSSSQRDRFGFEARLSVPRAIGTPRASNAGHGCGPCPNAACVRGQYTTVICGCPAKKSISSRPRSFPCTTSARGPRASSRSTPRIESHSPPRQGTPILSRNGTYGPVCRSSSSRSSTVSATCIATGVPVATARSTTAGNNSRCTLYGAWGDSPRSQSGAPRLVFDRRWAWASSSIAPRRSAPKPSTSKNATPPGPPAGSSPGDHPASTMSPACVVPVARNSRAPRVTGDSLPSPATGRTRRWASRSPTHSVKCRRVSSGAAQSDSSRCVCAFTNPGNTATFPRSTAVASAVVERAVTRPPSSSRNPANGAAVTGAMHRARSLTGRLKSSGGSRGSRGADMVVKTVGTNVAGGIIQSPHIARR